MPPTFVPPEYPLSWVTSVSHRAGGTLSTLTKAKAPFNLSGGRAVGTSGYAPYDPSPNSAIAITPRLSQRSLIFFVGACKDIRPRDFRDSPTVA
jgi:hypothetical protein